MEGVRARLPLPYRVGHRFTRADPLRADLVKFNVDSTSVPEPAWPSAPVRPAHRAPSICPRAAGQLASSTPPAHHLRTTISLLCYSSIFYHPASRASAFSPCRIRQPRHLCCYRQNAQGKHINWRAPLHARNRAQRPAPTPPLQAPGSTGSLDGEVLTNKSSQGRADAQRLVATRLLDRLHDPLGHFSRLQRIYPRAR